MIIYFVFQTWVWLCAVEFVIFLLSYINSGHDESAVR